MTRRSLLLLPAATAAAQSDKHAPVEEASMNAFATAYNAYTEWLKQGKIDLVQWRRVVRAWERLK